MLDELKKAVGRARFLVDQHGDGAPTSDHFLAKHGDALTAAVALAEATLVHYDTCRAFADSRGPLDALHDATKDTVAAQLLALDAYRATKEAT
jgi:hypothetical protein